MELGCPDRPCDCGCPDCNEVNPKSRTQEIPSYPSTYDVASGYKKPSPEDYTEAQVTENSGDSKRVAETVHHDFSSGYNKKEIVKQKPVKETLIVSKGCKKSETDYLGYCIAGLGFLFLLRLLSKDDDEKQKPNLPSKTR